MGHTRLADLRNASDKNGVAIRKKDPLEFEEFLARWRFGLKQQSVDWEGPRAVAELRDKKMLNFILREKKSYRTKSGETEWHDNWPEWQPHDLLRRVALEMRVYRHEAEARLVDRDFKEVDDFLRGILQRIKKRENQARFKQFRSVFFGLRDRVERARGRVVGFRNWKFAGLLWPELPRTNRVVRAIDRDTRLQVELGKMFADYLRQNGVSLETIARLILLAYLVGGLAAKDNDDIRTIYTNRVITVRKIRDKLRYKGLHTAAHFKGEES
jgi:hypothetical protein